MPKSKKTVSPKKDPKLAKLENQVKRYRELILIMVHAVQAQRDFQKMRKCHECDHFIADAFKKAEKV